MARIFLTGASGYIGGEVLHKIASASSQHEISCLVRDSEKAKTVKTVYPHVRIVQHDLDDVEVIKQEAENAEIVLHLASTNHLPSAKAIAEGLSNRNGPRPSYWIQMSGATVVCADEIKRGVFGEGSDKKYDDLEDGSVIRSLIKANPSRTVDNLVISQDRSVIKTAQVFGPLIYGQGHGPVHKRSIQAPEIARCTIGRKHGFRLGAGKNTWSNVHIHDLGDFFTALVEAAVAGKEELWNDQGFFCPENGAMSFGDLCASIAKECTAQGLLDEADQDTITAKEADAMSGHASILWGTNAVLTGSRERQLLAWNPSGKDLVAELPEIVRLEASKME